MSCFVQMGIIKRIQEDLSGRYRDPYPRDRWVVQLLLALVSRGPCTGVGMRSGLLMHRLHQIALCLIASAFACLVHGMSLS